jgi:hypothetical protein
VSDEVVYLNGVPLVPDPKPSTHTCLLWHPTLGYVLGREEQWLVREERRIMPINPPDAGPGPAGDA